MPNNNYVITPTGCFCRNDELYHHGVKGMKWGVRRKQIRGASADRSIGRIGASRSANKLRYEAANKDAEARFYGGRTKVHDNFVSRALDKRDAKLLNKAKNRNKAVYDISELSGEYAVARQKARKDKSYKKTPEYKAARNAYGKAVLTRTLLGDEAYIRMRSDINGGMSKRKAKGKAVVTSLLLGGA